MMSFETMTKRPVGRPRVKTAPERVWQLRRQGVSWRQIAKLLRIGSATAMRLLRSIDAGPPDIRNSSSKAFDRAIEI